MKVCLVAREAASIKLRYNCDVQGSAVVRNEWLTDMSDAQALESVATTVRYNRILARSDFSYQGGTPYRTGNLCSRLKTLHTPLSPTCKWSDFVVIAMRSHILGPRLYTIRTKFYSEYILHV